MILQRVKIIFLSIVMAFFFASFPLYEYSQRPFTMGELVSLSAGLFVGLGIALYLNQLWDPVELRPTKPDTTDPNTWWLRNAQALSILLGAVLSAIARILLEQSIINIIAAGIAGTGIMFFLNFAFRLLWYWPR